MIGELLAALATAAAAVCAAPWRLTTNEIFMRLALGRVAAGPAPALDPWLYSVPGERWRNVEWLGDLLLYRVHGAAGETGLVALKLVTLAAGWALLSLVARRRGGSPFIVAALAAIALVGCEHRLVERNEIFIHLLIPLYMLVLQAARADRRWLVALVPLGILWGNVHASFVLGWAIVGAALAGALIERDPRWVRSLAVTFCLQLALPLISRDGVGTYGLLVNVVRGSGALQAVKEFTPPEVLPATLARLPLHLFGILGLVSFAFRPNRRDIEGLLLVVAGLVLAHRAVRFFPVFALLALPVLATNLARAAGERRRVRLGLSSALLVVAVAMFIPAVRAARAATAVQDDQHEPRLAARWLAAHAPEGSRLFGPYTGGQWLMWEAPRLGLYIHPHFSHDSDLFERFLGEVLRQPERFEAEARRLNVNLALISYVDETQTLFEHMARSTEWRLVYWDGVFGVYARAVDQNRRLGGYAVLRPYLGFEYLDAVSDEALAPDLRRLREDGPAMHRAIVGYRAMSRAGSRRTEIERARTLLREATDEAWVPSLAAYLVQAHLALGEREQAREVLGRAWRAFPGNPRLQALLPR